MNKETGKNPGSDKFLGELLSLKDQILHNPSCRFEVPKDTSNIVIAGMGGSGIVGSIFREMYTKMPVILVNGYQIPEFVGKNTLFICISYSGNTEETLSALRQAKQKKANIAAITSGGALAEEVANLARIPAGLSPRSALGYMLMPLLHSFGAVTEGDLKETYTVLDRIDKENSEQKEVAKEIFDGQRLPVIYGTMPYGSIAYRWSTQFNENAKMLAVWNNFPELNHNHTMALKDGFKRDELYYICLVTGGDQRTNMRIPVTAEVTQTRFDKIISPVGRSELAKVMSLVHIGDYVTYHLALLRRKDPLDVTGIEALKARLASS